MQFINNMKQKTILFFACICMMHCDIKAQSREAIGTSTDILMFVTPASGFIATLVLEDYEGTKQLVFAGVTSIATSYLLKHVIKKQRPDGSDSHSFPSNHTAMSFHGASFIAQRYGWKYSIPAYFVSGYVAWGRVYAKRHDTWDVFAGAAIGIASTYIFTRPFMKKHNLAISPAIINNENLGVYASMTF
jgi:membrane-associated phospholipid phosphatase